MAGTKKIPMRKCLVCGEMKPKKELIRIVRPPDGEIAADMTGKKSGRGAYICRTGECISLARKQKRLEKAFSCKVDDSVYDALENTVSEDKQHYGQ